METGKIFLTVIDTDRTPSLLKELPVQPPAQHDIVDSPIGAAGTGIAGMSKTGPEIQRQMRIEAKGQAKHQTIAEIEQLCLANRDSLRPYWPHCSHKIETQMAVKQMFTDDQTGGKAKLIAIGEFGIIYKQFVAAHIKLWLNQTLKFPATSLGQMKVDLSLEESEFVAIRNG